MDKNRGAFVIILVFIILVFVVFLFQNFKFVEKQETQTTTTLLGEEETSGSIDKLCSQFEVNENEITCEEAANMALKRYPGWVYMIDKTQTTLPTPPGQETGSVLDTWLIGINLDTPTQYTFNPPTGRLEITIDSKTGYTINLKPIY